MKNFFKEPPLWFVFTTVFILTSALFLILFYYVSSEPAHNFLIKVSLGFGVVFGLIITFAVHELRRSDKFWLYFDYVEKLIECTEDREKLKSIFDNEYQTLIDKSLGGSQLHEIKRLKTIIEVKLKYVK